MPTPVWPIRLGELPTVIDLSHNNAGFRTASEFTALYAAGVRDVIHKASQGRDFVDPLYALRRPLSIAAGLGWHAYHFCTSDPIEVQQALFLRVIGQTVEKMWLALDAEPNRGATIDPPHAAAFAMAMDAAIGGIKSGSAPRRRALRYGGAALPTYRQAGWVSGPQWWAKYGPEPTVELLRSLGVPPENVVLWQETGSGRVSQHGPVDLSYARTPGF